LDNSDIILWDVVNFQILFERQGLYSIIQRWEPIEISVLRKFT